MGCSPSTLDDDVGHFPVEGVASGMKLLQRAMAGDAAARAKVTLERIRSLVAQGQAEGATVYLTDVLTDEGVAFDPGALQVVAREAGGSVRDSLSLLDQAIAHGGPGRVIPAEEVRSMLGLADKTQVFDLMKKIFSGEIESASAPFRRRNKRSSAVRTKSAGFSKKSSPT